MAATRVIRRLRDLQDVETAVDPGFGSSPVDDGSGVYPLTRVTTVDDLNGVLASVAYVDWHDAVFQPGWQNVGPPWSPVRWRRTLNNVVHIEGKASYPADFDPQSTWLPIFQLPADCKPLGAIEYACLSNDNSMSKVVVWGDGMVIWGGYVTGVFATNIPYVALAAINFSVGVAS